MAIPDTPFGARVRERLRDDRFVWLTTVGEDGTPQPNPVWFLWDGGDEVLVYNDNRARRLERFANGCRVSLAFQAGPDGMDFAVLTGTARLATGAPAPQENDEYLAKYSADIAALDDEVGGFAQRYDVPVRITIERVRGF
ncbi:MAG: PPOX class F420-dependent oxidoreductase [Cellulomonas sp. 73-92]|uniref:TIGR03667 family PPOX class F420-dependent oxidoreductase n=1 Tax=Cellulomonas sp. 73-92 TaxID=1895740 RepID=UPI000928C9CA|nr:TIGR03667 family PPOX class F420-dependent oxidoreductase [Cellulomonas sp. 73-92]OJV81009.1 MAG: PPOX class F420-dependent oxidoreductase [Cellulomonas sp. 73-92]